MTHRKQIFIGILMTAFLFLGCKSDTGVQEDTERDTTNQANGSQEQSENNHNDNNQDTTQGNNGNSDTGNQDSNNEQDGPIKGAVVETKPSNWYIRVTAEDPARGMKTNSTQLGELEVDDAVEKHTLKALKPFGGTYLDVVFKDPVGVESGEYKVNFHTYEDGMDDSWHFTVKTDKDNVNADILLSWRGVYVLKPYIDDENRQRYSEYRSTTNPIIRHMKLVDSVTGEEVAVAVDGKVQTYSFNMDGSQTRNFEWIVQAEEVTLAAQQKKEKVVKSKALKMSVKAKSRQIQKTKVKSFDLSKPPMIEENRYGK